MKMQGKDLLRIRSKLGLTQAELAHALGYSGTPATLALYVWRFESGERAIPFAIARLAYMFDLHGIPRKWLL